MQKLMHWIGGNIGRRHSAELILYASSELRSDTSSSDTSSRSRSSTIHVISGSLTTKSFVQRSFDSIFLAVCTRLDIGTLSKLARFFRFRSHSLPSNQSEIELKDAVCNEHAFFRLCELCSMRILLYVAMFSIV
jgi:hypothetical protein